MARKRKTDYEPIVSASGPAAQTHRPAVIRQKHFPAPPEPSAGSEIEPPAPQPSEPSREEIARLAYTYWESRNHQGGSAEEDWLRAERELRSRVI